MALFLGVDMGGTASRWAAVDDAGRLMARGEASGASGLIFDAESAATFAMALRSIRQALPGPVARAHFGITGAGFSRHPKAEAEIQSIFGLASDAFSYSNDLVLAWHAAFPAGQGHLVSAGTGSIGVTIGADGDVTVVGGRGILIDDGGSGSWIALRALDRVYRLIDEHGSPMGAETLAEALFAEIGGDDRDAMRAFVYGEGRGRIGMLARQVAEAARHSDALAMEILERAGLELVRLARALLRRKGQAPIAFIGGALALDPIIRTVIERELTSETFAFPKVDAALHGARMARDRGLMT